MPRTFRFANTFVSVICVVISAVGTVNAQPGHRPPPPHERGPHNRQGQDNEPLADNAVTITERDGYRYITANGIPEHTPGRFPNHGNPNPITEQRHRYRVPLNPKIADEVTPMIRMPFGVAINGVPLDPGTAGYWSPGGGRPSRDRSSGWNYEALSGKIDLGLDDHQAHVQPNGAYHYHGLPTGLITHLVEENRNETGHLAMTLIGYAADGFPIYARYGYEAADDSTSDVIELTSSYQLKQGKRPSGSKGPGGRYDGTFVQDFEFVPGTGGLDECNGRAGVTPEYPDGTYYYVITDTFPFIPRHFRGTPDDSFQRRGPASGNRNPENQRGDRPGRRPPPPR